MSFNIQNKHPYNFLTWLTWCPQGPSRWLPWCISKPETSVELHLTKHACNVVELCSILQFQNMGISPHMLLAIPLCWDFGLEWGKDSVHVTFMWKLFQHGYFWKQCKRFIVTLGLWHEYLRDSGLFRLCYHAFPDMTGLKINFHRRYFTI